MGVDSRQVFIPCDPEAGVEAEVDWGRRYAIQGSEKTLLKLFCIKVQGLKAETLEALNKSLLKE